MYHRRSARENPRATRATALDLLSSPRIVGGKNAPDGKYPYQVSLRSDGSHFCGGSILNKRWILSAAHCLLGFKNDSVTVVAGTNLLKGGKEQKYQSQYIETHQGFGVDRTHDLGMIRVSRDIVFNDKVKPIKLPSVNFTKTNYPAVLTGWGDTELGGFTPNNLQEITLKIISQQKCKIDLGFNITDSHICTLTKSGEGACFGDSGSPLVADGIQVGIVSFGQPCAVGKPDVYTRVYTFIDWITERLKKNF